MDFQQIKALVRNTLTGHVKDTPITPIEHEAMATAIVDKIEEVDGKVYIADITNITGAELNANLGKAAIYANTLYGIVPLAGFEFKNIFNEDGSRETIVYFNFKGIHPASGQVTTTVVEWNRATNTTKTYLRTDNDNIALVDTTWEYDDVKDLIDKGRNVFCTIPVKTNFTPSVYNTHYTVLLPFSGYSTEHNMLYNGEDIRPLPSDYSQIESLINNGNNGLSLPIQVNEYTRIEVVCSVRNNDRVYRILGSLTSGCFLNYLNGILGYGVGNITGNVSVHLVDYVYYKIVMTAHSLTIEGVTGIKIPSQSSFTGQGELPVNYEGTDQRLKSLKVYDDRDSSLVFDGVPCINYRNRPALFDVVSGRDFYSVYADYIPAPPITADPEIQFVGYNAAERHNTKVYLYKKGGKTQWLEEAANNDFVCFDGAKTLPTFNEVTQAMLRGLNIILKWKNNFYFYKGYVKLPNRPGVEFVLGNQIITFQDGDSPYSPMTIYSIENIGGISIDNDGYLVQDADD